MPVLWHALPNLSLLIVLGFQSMPPATPNQSVTPVTYTVNSLGHAALGDVDLVELAQNYGTPLYVLDGETFRAMAASYTQTLKAHYPADALVIYASKANMNMALCKLSERLGLGLDVVSGGELYTALQAGFDLQNVCFNGNNKSEDELELAIHQGVGRITVDNPYELDLIHQIAEKKGVTVDILIRVSPGIECHTHDYIKTGQLDSKFGFHLPELVPAMEKLTGPYQDTLCLKGLHAHIGSQIFETRPYLDLVEVMLNIYYNIRQTYNLTLADLNLGGGIGIAYTPADDPLQVEDTLTAVCEKLVAYANRLDFPLPRLILEPGRSMVATAGMTLYTLGSQKTVPGVRKYVAIDGGMGDNIRPALYQANYTCTLANKANLPAEETITVAGKYCESGDILIPEVRLPACEPGDILAVFGTGAYNYSMASNYNRVPRPAVVLVDHNEAHLLVRREAYENICALDVIPSYLMSPAAP